MFLSQFPLGVSAFSVVPQLQRASFGPAVKASGEDLGEAAALLLSDWMSVPAPSVSVCIELILSSAVRSA